MNESNEKAVTAKPTTSDVVKAILSEQFSPLSWSQQMDLQEQEITPIATQKSSPDIPGAGKFRPVDSLIRCISCLESKSTCNLFKKQKVKR
jgi:hypothetical protein